MVQCGDADSLITGIYSNYGYLSNVARDTVGIAPGHQHFATMHPVSYTHLALGAGEAKGEGRQ